MVQLQLRLRHASPVGEDRDELCRRSQGASVGQRERRRLQLAVQRQVHVSVRQSRQLHGVPPVRPHRLRGGAERLYLRLRQAAEQHGDSVESGDGPSADVRQRGRLRARSLVQR